MAGLSGTKCHGNPHPRMGHAAPHPRVQDVSSSLGGTALRFPPVKNERNTSVFLRSKSNKEGSGLTIKLSTDSNRESNCEFPMLNYGQNWLMKPLPFWSISEFISNRKRW